MEILRGRKIMAQVVALLSLSCSGYVFAQSVDISYEVPAHIFVTKVVVNDKTHIAAINLERGYTYASTDFIKENGDFVSIAFEQRAEKFPVRKLRLKELSELTGSGVALVLGRDMFKGDKVKIDFINMKLTIGSDLLKKGKSYRFEPETGMIESPIKKFLPFLTAMIETDEDGCPRNSIDLLTGEAVNTAKVGQAVLGPYATGRGMYVIRKIPRPVALLNALDFCGVLEIDMLQHRIWFEESSSLRIRYILSFMTPLIFEISDGKLILGGSRDSGQDVTIREQNWRGGVVTKIGALTLDSDVLNSDSKFEALYVSYVKERNITIVVDGKEIQLRLDK